MTGAGLAPTCEYLALYVGEFGDEIPSVHLSLYNKVVVEQVDRLACGYQAFSVVRVVGVTPRAIFQVVVAPLHLLSNVDIVGLARGDVDDRRLAGHS